MKILRKTISLAVVVTFVVTNCAQAAPVTVQDSHLRPASVANAPQSDLAAAVKSSSAGEVPSELEIRELVRNAGFEELLKSERKDEFAYFVRAYQRFFEKDVPLVIGGTTKPGEERTFIPSAGMAEQEQKKKIGRVDYSELVKKQDEYKKAAKNAFLILNGLDGGLGKNIDRGTYLDARFKQAKEALPAENIDPAILKRPIDPKTGHRKLGAKGVDTVREVEISDEQGNKIRKRLSIAEIKLLRLISEINNGDYTAGNVLYQPLISDDSKQSYVDLLRQDCLVVDLLKDGYKGKTYRDVLKKMGVIKSLPDYRDNVLEEFNTALLPLVDPETKQLLPKTKATGAPGGHGQLGMLLLLRALEMASDSTLAAKAGREVESGTPEIRIFFNGDGVSNMADPVIIGWMTQEKIPIIIITSIKAGIDKKGGEIGGEVLLNGAFRTQIMELKQAQNVDRDKPVGWYAAQYGSGKSHEKTFYDEGLIGEGKGRQLFNTNVALINYSLLVCILRDLLNAGISKEEIIANMTPDPIKNKKEVGGKIFLCADSALASALLNLDALFDSNRRAQAVLEKNKVGSKKLVSLVNTSLTERSQFFTPFKMSYDFLFQVCTDYYKIDTQKWLLEDDDEYSKEGPPILTFSSNVTPTGKTKGKDDLDYYDNITNLIHTLGKNAIVKDSERKGTVLRSLTIEGLVTLPNSRLYGDVVIINEGEDEINLYDDQFKQELLGSKVISEKDGKLIFEDVLIIIRADNKKMQITKLKQGQDIDIEILRQKMLFFGVEEVEVNRLITEIQNNVIKLDRKDINMLNQESNVMGKLDNRLMHETGLLHRAAAVFVMSPDGETLLQRMAHNIGEEQLRFSILREHVLTGESYKDAIMRGLKAQLGLAGLNGYLYRISQEGEGEYRSPQNNENRSIFVYVLHPDEAKKIKKSIAALETQKAKGTREDFEVYLGKEQEKRSRKGEIFGRHFVDVPNVIRAERDQTGRYLEVKEPFKEQKGTEKVHFTSNLLEHLLNRNDIVEAIKVFENSLWQESVEEHPKYTEINLKSSSAGNAAPSVSDINEMRIDLADLRRFGGADVDKKRIQKEQGEVMAERLEVLATIKDNVSRSTDLQGYVDMHCHTFYSDGYDSPSAVVFNAWCQGMKSVAIADHNTFEGLEEAMAAGEILGIRVIPGIEFNFREDNLGIVFGDLLVYFPVKDVNEYRELMRELEKNGILSETNNRVYWNLKKQWQIIERFNRKHGESGLEITPEDVKGRLGLYPNIWQLGEILFRKYSAEHLTNYLNSVVSKNDTKLYEAIKELVVDRKLPTEKGGSPAITKPLHAGRVFIRTDKEVYIDEEELKGPEYANGPFSLELGYIIGKVKRLGGVVVLPHPNESRFAPKGRVVSENVISLFDRYNFDGIELSGKYKGEEENSKALEMIRKILAGKPTLLLTVGSDYHGDPAEPDLKMGPGRDGSLEKEKLGSLGLPLDYDNIMSKLEQISEKNIKFSLDSKASLTAETPAKSSSAGEDSVKEAEHKLLEAKINLLIEQLKDRGQPLKVREAAVEELGNIGLAAKAAVPILKKMLEFHDITPSSLTDFSEGDYVPPELQDIAPVGADVEPDEFYNIAKKIGFKVEKYKEPTSLRYRAAAALEKIERVPKSSSAGILNLDELTSLTPQALDAAIASATSEDIKVILADSKLAAEVAKLGISGTIVFNDEPLSAEQKRILTSILGRDTQALQELERLMNCTIRLKSQLTSKEIKGKFIIVSDTKLNAYPDAKYLLFKQVVELENSYLPVIPMIAMAKGLLNLTDKNQTELINSIKELSRSLCKKPLIDKVIEEYIQNGIFSLELPKPEAYDYQKLEQLQRQALAALIAA